MRGAVLYYPYHLCSRDSLERLLARYELVHFRDYMAMQLTPTSGTMAHPDRMSDSYPDLSAQDRIVEGHNVSGPLSAELERRLDRDFRDRDWREIFQLAVRHERRFRHGLVGRGDEEYFRPWLAESWASVPITLADIRQMSYLKLNAEPERVFNYGTMLLNTSAALWYTIQLCQRYALEAVTDSPAHDRLLRRILLRDRIELRACLLKPKDEEFS
jgi:hypothetical protein